MALPSLGQVATQGVKDTYKTAIADPATNLKSAAMSPIDKFTRPVSSFLKRAAGQGSGDPATQIEKNTGDAKVKIGNSNSLLARIADATEATAKSVAALAGLAQRSAAKAAEASKVAGREDATRIGPPTKKQADAKKNEEEARKFGQLDLFGKVLLAGAVIKGLIENLETPLGEFEVSFSTIAMGLTGIAAMVLPKIIKAYKALKAAYIAFSAFSIKEFVGNQISTLKSIMGFAWKVISAPFRLLKAIYNSYTVFLIKEFIGGQMTALKSIMSSAWAKLAKPLKLLQLAFTGFTVFFLTTFIPGMVSAIGGMIAAMTPALVAAAPFIAGALMLAAQMYAMKKMLDKVTEALGFESITQTIMYGVALLKDGLARLGNFFIRVSNGLVNMVKDAIKYLPDFMVTDGMRKFANSETGTIKELDTNNAARYYEENSKKAKGDATPTEETGSNLLNKMSEQNARALRSDQAQADKLRAAAEAAGVDVQPGMKLAGRFKAGEVVSLNVDGKNVELKPSGVKPAPKAGTVIHSFADEDMRAAPVTIINNIDNSSDVKSGVQNISNNPMGTGAPPGI